MAYLSQPWFNREIVNRFAMATGVVHSETLTLIKRASKQPQKIPVTPVEVDGVKYLVSTRGECPIDHAPPRSLVGTDRPITWFLRATSASWRLEQTVDAVSGTFEHFLSWTVGL